MDPPDRLKMGSRMDGPLRSRIPSIGPMNHVYRGLSIPDGVPIELKPSPGKGWGAFATRPVSRGTVLLTEKPLFTVRIEGEVVNEIDIARKVMTLDNQTAIQFLRLCTDAHQGNANLLQPFFDNKADTEAGDTGVYALHPRVNHSCVPNVRFRGPEGETLSIAAIGDIKPGEEITAEYSPRLRGMTRRERHEVLGFICRCETCSIEDPHLQLLSDMRRRLIRGLHYLILGVNVDGKKDPAATAIITDPALRETAEAFRIPRTNRVIYSFLVMHLLELEGLLGTFRGERWFQGIYLHVVRGFEDASTGRILSRAFAHDTWRDKFLTAMETYGRVDGMDEELWRTLTEVGGFYLDPSVNLLSRDKW